jgi:hypothetical protein
VKQAQGRALRRFQQSITYAVHGRTNSAPR